MTRYHEIPKIPAISIAIIFLCAIATSFALMESAFAEESLTTGDTDASGNSAASEETQKTNAKTPKYATVAAIELNQTSVKLKNNEEFQFEATLIPSVEGKKIKKKNQKITWSISNSKVARITENGLVQGKRTGKAIVTAKTNNGTIAKAKVKVKVNKNKIAKKIPILTYHRVASNSAKRKFYRGDDLAVSASTFKRQMKWLHDNGYYTVSTSELRDWRVEGAFLPKKSVLVTMDDGFYETYYVAYPILKKYDQKATSFLVGHRTHKKTSNYNPNSSSDHYIGQDIVKKIRAEYPNLEFQSHTYCMHFRASSGYGIATAISEWRIKRDFKRNKRFGFTALAYPFGHTSANFYKVLKADKDINIAFGYIMHWPATRKSPIYNMPRFKVMGDGSMSEFIDKVSTAG